MGEPLWTYVWRRLLALSQGEIAALMTTMRQLGVGRQGRHLSPTYLRWVGLRIPQCAAGQDQFRREKLLWYD